MAVERCRDAPDPGPEARDRGSREDQHEDPASYVLPSEGAGSSKDGPQELGSQEIVRRVFLQNYTGQNQRLF